MTTAEVTAISVQGSPVQLRRGGKGSPVIYFHDELGVSWPPLLDRLAGGFSIASIDLPGFNDSPRPPWVDDVDDAAYFLADVLRVLGEGSPVLLMGSSLGGWLALEAAVRSPELVRRLAVIGPPGLDLVDDSPADPFFMTADERAALFFNRGDAQPVLDELRQIRNEAMTARLVWQPRFISPKLQHRIHRITAPTCVIWGADDRFLSSRHGEVLATSLPSGRFEMVVAAGHYPALEQPEQTAALVSKFFNGT